ncbi:MAG: hypothetical protein V4454_18855 [Pseudomonadota bacterium]
MEEPLDEKQVSYFRARYSRLDADELAELNARRDTLADEALAALDVVMFDQGINPDVIQKFQPVKPVLTDDAKQAEDARKIFRGGLSVACQVAGGLVLWLPVQTALRNVLLGAIISGLIAVFTLWVGSVLGKQIVRTICQESETTLIEKRRSLWILLTCEFVLMILVPGVIATFMSK